MKARTGYLEPMEYNRRRRGNNEEPERTPVEAALANPLFTPGAPMRVFAAPYKRSGRNATVVVAVDLESTGLAFTERDGAVTADLEVRHLATDVNHKIYPEYQLRTALVRADADEAPPAVRVVSEFDVPSGRYQVRVAMASGDRHGSVVYDVEVPDFRDGPLSLSGVALASAGAHSESVLLRGERPRRTSNRARQCRRAVCEPTEVLQGALTPGAWDAEPADAYLLQGVLPWPPTTIREFRPDDTLALFAEIYDNNGRARRDPPYLQTLQARLHDASGAIVRTMSEERSSRAETRESGGHGFTLYLPLDGVPPGQYVIQVEARSERHDEHRAVRNVPIRVH